MPALSEHDSCRDTRGRAAEAGRAVGILWYVIGSVGKPPGKLGDIIRRPTQKDRRLYYNTGNLYGIVGRAAGSNIEVAQVEEGANCLVAGVRLATTLRKVQGRERWV